MSVDEPKHDHRWKLLFEDYVLSINLDKQLEVIRLSVWVIGPGITRLTW